MLRSAAELEALRAKVRQEAWNASALSGKAEALSLDEEMLFQRFYLQQLGVMNRHLVKLPDRVQTCAAVFYLRFFLVQPVTAHHPKYVFLAALLLASKVEENRLDAATICRRADKPDWDKEVLKVEVVLLEALEFRVRLEHPHTCVLGWMESLKEGSDNSFDATAILAGVSRESVDTLVNELHTTDAPLRFKPSLIALGAIVAVAANEKLTERAKQIVRERTGDDAPLVELLEKFVPLARSPVAAASVAPLEKKLAAWIKASKKPKKKAKAAAGAAAAGGDGPEKNDDDDDNDDDDKPNEKKRKRAEELEQRERRLVEGSPSQQGGEFMIKTNMKRGKDE